MNERKTTRPKCVDIENPVIKYMAALDRGDFEEALSYFSPSAIYCVPGTPNSPNAQSGVNWRRGHHEIRDHFERRGVVPITHNVHEIITAAETSVLRGTVEIDEETTALFISWAEIDEAGLISQYMTTSLTMPVSQAHTLIQD